MSHVRKTANGRYEARYRGPDGRERCRRFDTKREARGYLERIGVDRQRGQWCDPAGARTHLDEWVEHWWATTVDLRPSSRARDESYLRTHVLPIFGKAPLGSIGQLDVRTWIAELSASGRAPATVHKAYQVLSKVMRAAVDAQLIAQSPCRNIPLPKIDRDEMRFLAPDEITTLAEVIEPRYRALVLFDAYCGLRLGELAGLRRARVDLLRREVRVSEVAVEVRGHLTFGAPKTKAGRRTVPLPPFVAEELSQHVARYVDPAGIEWMFPGRDGGVLRAKAWRSRFWQPAVRASGLGHVRPHDLRHTAVALWIAAGAIPKQIATWAGHTSVSVVLDRYGHLFPGHEESVVARLEDMAASARPARDAAVVALGTPNVHLEAQGRR